MKRITIAIAMVAVGIAVGLLVFGFGSFGDSEGTRGNTDNSYMDTSTYIGSSACSGCHSDEHGAWETTLHALTLQAPTASTVLGDFNIDPTLNDTANGIPDVTIDLDPAGYTVTMDGNTFTVLYTMGLEWKQVYLTQIDNSLYVLPIQWNVEDDEWAAYNLDQWYDNTGNFIPQPSDLKNSWDRSCAGCHTTGTDVQYNTTSGEWMANWTELGISCESCHGPASDHNGNTAYIWKDLDSQICGQCHAAGGSNGTLPGSTDPLDYPWSATQGWYMPGDTLSEFHVPGGVYWGDGITSKMQAQQYNDWLHSGHAKTAPSYAQNDNCMSCRSTEGFIEAAGGEPAPDAANATWTITCSACHDTHEASSSDHMLRLSESTLCVTCHTIGEGSTVEGEPHHAQKEIVAGSIIITEVSDTPWKNGAVGCSDCHMPKTAASAGENDIASHLWHAITPEYGASYNMPNSCTITCHDGTTGFPMTDDAANGTVNSWHDNVEEWILTAEPNLTAALDAWTGAHGKGFTAAQLEDALDLLHHANYTYHVVETGIGTVHNSDFAEDLLEYSNTKANEVIDMLKTGTASGRIVDPDEEPISGATITLGDLTLGTTLSDGTFSFDLAPGTHTLTVTLGEDTETISVTVTAGQVSDTGDTHLGEAEEQADNLMLYLLIIVVIIIVVIIIAVVAMKRRGGPIIEEEMEPEPEPVMEPELEE